MTHTLAGLEKAKHIEMVANESDARSKRVWITDKGRELHGTTIRSAAAKMNGIEELFSLDRVKQILPELEALREIMDARRS